MRTYEPASPQEEVEVNARLEYAAFSSTHYFSRHSQPCPKEVTPVMNEYIQKHLLIWICWKLSWLNGPMENFWLAILMLNGWLSSFSDTISSTTWGCSFETVRRMSELYACIECSQWTAFVADNCRSVSVSLSRSREKCMCQIYPYWIIPTQHMYHICRTVSVSSPREQWCHPQLEGYIRLSHYSRYY